MGEDKPQRIARNNMLRMAAEVVAAYVGNNPLPTAQLREVIRAVYNALTALERGEGKAGWDSNAPRNGCPASHGMPSAVAGPRQELARR